VGPDPGQLQLYIVGLVASAMLCAAMVLSRGGAL
jgi:hypothetical protein